MEEETLNVFPETTIYCVEPKHRYSLNGWSQELRRKQYIVKKRLDKKFTKESIREKRRLLKEFDNMKDMDIPIQREFNMSTPLDELRYEYEMLKYDEEEQKRIREENLRRRNQRDMQDTLAFLSDRLADKISEKENVSLGPSGNQTDVEVEHLNMEKTFLKHLLHGSAHVLRNNIIPVEKPEIKLLVSMFASALLTPLCQKLKDKIEQEQNSNISIGPTFENK
jgi:hypothetical protein